MQIQILDDRGHVTSTEEIVAEPPFPQGAAYSQQCIQESDGGCAIIGTNLDSEDPTAKAFNVIASNGVLLACNLA